MEEKKEEMKKGTKGIGLKEGGGKGGNGITHKLLFSVVRLLP